MLNYRQNGRRQLGRPLDSILVEAERGLFRPNSRGLIIIIIIIIIIIMAIKWAQGRPLQIWRAGQALTGALN